MKSKRITVILVSVAFLIIAILSCVSIFSVRKIETTFAVDENTDTASIQAVLDKFIGKNITFLNLQEIEDSLKDFQYMEVLSISKQYPNVIKVSIKERKEVYYFEKGDKVYVTAKDGFVLNSYPISEFADDGSRDMIRLSITGLDISNVEIGTTIKTSDDLMLSTVFEMAEEVFLTDCIREIELLKAVEREEAVFYTYTGVKILITKIKDDGVNKIKVAFTAYDESQDAGDYEKTFKTIEVVKMDDGYIYPVWTDR
jgi:hypothetical protein